MCSCGFRERVGIPCRHMLCVLDGAVEISMMMYAGGKHMINIMKYEEESKMGEINTLCYIPRFWKSLIMIAILGDLLYSAQQVCFAKVSFKCQFHLLRFLYVLFTSTM